MPNKVLETEAFSKLFDILEKEEQEWIKKMILQLEQTSTVGKPLGFKWFREKKFKGKRLYFLVYEKQQKILLVAYGAKKDQKKIIYHILENKEKYKKLVESNQ
mgnify:CR=1 FL=1